MCVAVCRSVLWRVAVCCGVLQCVENTVRGCCSVCCSVLQHVAACCSMLQHVAACCSVVTTQFENAAPIAVPNVNYQVDRAVVLQCVAVCCSVLQCVAVCCSVLQCVAVCCLHTQDNSPTQCELCIQWVGLLS